VETKDTYLTIRRQIEMPISLDGLSFSGLTWTFKLLPSTQRPALGMLGYLPVDLKRDQQMVS
jgi:hypothetical protein